MRQNTGPHPAGGRERFCWLVAGSLPENRSRPGTRRRAANWPSRSDVLDKAKEWNSDKFAPPPTEFRKGKVTARQLDPKALTKHASGFTVQLPSKAPSRRRASIKADSLSAAASTARSSIASMPRTAASLGREPR